MRWSVTQVTLAKSFSPLERPNSVTNRNSTYCGGGNGH
jgi:hypothetical protein